MIPLDDNIKALNSIQFNQETCELCSARAAWKFISPVSGLMLAMCSHHSYKTPIPYDWQEIPL